MFDLFKKKKEEIPEVDNVTGRKPQSVLTDEDRRRAAEVNRQRYRLERKRKALELKREELELQRLEKEIDEEFSDEQPTQNGSVEDQIMLKLLDTFLAKSNAQSQPQQEQPKEAEQPQEIELSDDQVEQIINSIPKPMIKKFQKMSNDDLMSLIEEQHAGLSGMSKSKLLSSFRQANA